MPIVVAWIAEMLLSIVGQLAISAVLALGVGLVANKAAPALIDATGISAMLGSGGQMMTDYAGWMGIDKAMTIILSAWAGRALMSAARLHLTKKAAA